MKRPLEDIRVLDLSRVYAAPAGTMILGDLGAEVIRIESLKGSDSMREWGPFVNGESTYYFSANRNKRSITLDLKTEKGKEVFLYLVKKADVIVENFKTGTMERLGLEYDYLKTINDQIIMCSVTGFGQTGPYKTYPGFDPVIQAMSGLMDVTGPKDGEATKVGVPIADILTSNYVALSILAAIRMRDFNQVGQHIDLSLLDVQLSNLANVSSSFLNTGVLAKRLGNSHNNVVPYQVFYCKDHPIMLCAGNNGLFMKLCDVLGHSEWKTDPRYVTNEKRMDNEDELVEKIGEIIKRKTADEWLALFSDAKIPAGKVNTVDQAFDDPQVKAREGVEILQHPTIGEIKMTKSPLRFSGLNIQSEYAPPLLGEHTEEVLLEIGYSEEEVMELKENDIIGGKVDKILDR
ncbi:CaiB/BaiF CoA transferase family protein [Oceanobacillus senegalensis]|uniref:CaiB/BaiF CoA transferase family protein n=1 Tax=Oceanobacillus senegalensis TaxID=1936063 RepID=UPI000A3076CC|nr:CaiB/BaiF CoA-transferase family protein [Oceanobacillus senegalensis]